MPSLGIVPGAERTMDERLFHGSPGHWVYKRATNECEVPPLDIGVQAIQLSPYRSGVAGPQHTRLLLSPAFQPCACPLACKFCRSTGSWPLLVIVSRGAKHT